MVLCRSNIGNNFIIKLRLSMSKLSDKNMKINQKRNKLFNKIPISSNYLILVCLV